MHEASASADRFFVLLNVGGSMHTVPSDTLMKFPDSLLSKLVSEKRQTISNNNSDPPIYIDRDGERFRFVLDAYRDGRVVLPRGVAIGAFENDLKYFGLSGVFVQQERPTFDECLLGTRDGLLSLTERLKKTMVDQESKYQLHCASSLGSISEGVKNSSESFALWAVREAILQYITNSEGSYEAFLHEFLNYNRLRSDKNYDEHRTQKKSGTPLTKSCSSS